MDPISASAIASGIAWVGKVAWKVYQKYNDLKKEAEQKANEYWNKIKTRATGSMLVINGFLGPVFGVISTTFGISLSLAASVFTFVVAMVGIGFTTGLMWGLKPRSHNWKEEKKLNYVKNPKLILQYGYHLLYKKILYYWLKFGVHIVRFGVPVLFGLLAAIGAATPIGWAAIGVVAATMVVGFGIGLGAGYLVGKHYRYDPDAKKDDINEQKIDDLKDDLNELGEQEQEQLDKLIDLGLGDKLRFAPQRAYGLNEFSPESLITLLLLKNNGALPESNQPANQGLDEVEEKLPDHIARINDYYNPGVRLLALSGAINSDRDLIKGPAFVENFHAYVKQERDVIEAMQKYQVQNKDLKGHYDKVQKEFNAANDLVTLESKASEKFEQLKNKYKDIEIDQRNGLVLWDGSLLGHIDDPQFIREIESGELKYIDDKGVEQTFMVNQKEDTKRKELAKALGDYWSACEAVSSKLKSASFIGAQGHGFIIPDECGPELNNYRYFSYAMLKRQAQLYFPAFQDVHARIEDAIKENKESDQIGWGLRILTFTFPLLPVPIPIVGWIFRNAFEMGRNRNWSWRGLLSFKNACQSLGKSLYYTSEDPLMKELHARVKSDLDNRKAFMAEHETALATALHNDFQSEMTKDDEADQKDEYKIHEQDVGHDKAISKYIEDNGDHDIARLSLVHYAELQTFIKVELDHELQVERADSDKAKWLRQFSENITSHFHAITNILNIDVYRKAFIEAFFTSLLAGEGQDDDLLFHKALKESVTISNAEDVAVWLITSHELNQWIDNHWPMVVSKWPALKAQVAALSRDENADQLKAVLTHDTEARQAFVNICLKDLKNTQFFKVEKHFHIKDVKQIDIDQIDCIQLVERIERNRHLIRTQFDNFSKLQDAAQPPSFKKVVNWFITNAPVAFIRKTFPQLRQDVRESEAKAAYAKGDLSDAFSQFIGEHADQSGLNHYIPVNTRNEHAQDFIEAYNQSHSSILSLLGRLQNRAYNDKNEDIALLCSLPGYGRVFHKLAPDVLDEKASEIAQDFANFEALITHCHTTYLEHGDGKKYQKTLADLYAHGILGEAFKASVHQFTQDEKKATPEAAAIDLISQCAHQPLDQHRFHYPSFKHLHAHPQWDQLVGEVPACLSGIKTTLGYSYVNHLQALSPVRRAEMSHALKKEPKTQLDDEKQVDNQRSAQFIEKNADLYLTDEGLRDENLQFIAGLRHIFMRAYQLMCMHHHQGTLGKDRHKEEMKQIGEAIKKDYKGSYGLMFAKVFDVIQEQVKNTNNYMAVSVYLKAQIEQLGMMASYYRFVHPHYFSPMLARLFKMDVCVDKDQTVTGYVVGQLKAQLPESVWQGFIKKDRLDLNEFLNKLNAPEMRAIIYRIIVSLKEKNVSTRSKGQEAQPLGLRSFENLCQQVLDYLAPKQNAYNPAERLRLRLRSLTGDYGELMNTIFELPPSQATVKSATAMLQTIMIGPDFKQRQAAYLLLLKIINGALKKDDLEDIDDQREKIAVLLPKREFADVRYDYAEDMLDKLVQRYCLDYHYVHAFKAGNDEKIKQYKNLYTVFKDKKLKLPFKHIDLPIANFVFRVLLDPNNSKTLKHYYAVCSNSADAEILTQVVQKSIREVRLSQENIRLWLGVIRSDPTGHTQQKLKCRLNAFVASYKGDDTYIFPLLLDLMRKNKAKEGTPGRQHQYHLLEEVNRCLEKRFKYLSEAGSSASLYEDDYQVLAGPGADALGNKLIKEYIQKILCANPLHKIDYAGKPYCVGDFIDQCVCLEKEDFSEFRKELINDYQRNLYKVLKAEINADGYDPLERKSAIIDSDDLLTMPAFINRYVQNPDRQKALIALHQKKVINMVTSRIQADPFGVGIKTIESNVLDEGPQAHLINYLYAQRRQLLHTVLTQGHCAQANKLHTVILKAKKDGQTLQDIAELFGCSRDFSAINDAFYAFLSSLKQQDCLLRLQGIVFDLCNYVLTTANERNIVSSHYIDAQPSEADAQFTQRLDAFRTAGITGDTKKIIALLQIDDCLSRVFRWVYLKDDNNALSGRWRSSDMKVLLKDKDLNSEICRKFVEQYLHGRVKEVWKNLRQAEFKALHHLFCHVSTQRQVEHCKATHKKLVGYWLSNVPSKQVQAQSAFEELKNKFIQNLNELLPKNKRFQINSDHANVLITDDSVDQKSDDQLDRYEQASMQEALQATHYLLEWVEHTDVLIGDERDNMLNEIYKDIASRLREAISIQVYLHKLEKNTAGSEQWLQAMSALQILLHQQIDSSWDTSGQMHLLCQSLQATCSWLDQRKGFKADLVRSELQRQWQENAPALTKLIQQVRKDIKHQCQILTAYGKGIRNLMENFTIRSAHEQDGKNQNKVLDIIERNTDIVEWAHQGFELLRDVNIEVVEKIYTNFVSYLDMMIDKLAADKNDGDFNAWSIDKFDISAFEYILFLNDDHLRSLRAKVTCILEKVLLINGGSAEIIDQLKQIHEILSKDLFQSYQIITHCRKMNDVAELFLQEFDLTQADLTDLMNLSSDSANTHRKALFSKLSTYKSVQELLTAIKALNNCDMPQFYKDQLMKQLEDLLEKSKKERFHPFSLVHQFLSEQINMAHTVDENKLFEAITQYLLKRYEYQAERNLGSYAFYYYRDYEAGITSHHDLYNRIHFIYQFSDYEAEPRKRMLLRFLSIAQGIEDHGFESVKRWMENTLKVIDNKLRLGYKAFSKIVQKNKIFNEIAQYSGDFEALPVGQKKVLLAPVGYKDLVYLLTHIGRYDVRSQIITYINNMDMRVGFICAPDCQPRDKIQDLRSYYDSGLKSEMSRLIEGHQDKEFVDALDDLRTLGFTDLHRCKAQIEELLSDKEKHSPATKELCDGMRAFIHKSDSLYEYAEAKHVQLRTDVVLSNELNEVLTRLKDNPEVVCCSVIEFFSKYEKTGHDLQEAIRQKALKSIPDYLAHISICHPDSLPLWYVLIKKFSTEENKRLFLERVIERAGSNFVVLEWFLKQLDCVDVLEYLINRTDRYNPDEVNADHMSALHIALKYERNHVVKRLLTLNPNRAAAGQHDLRISKLKNMTLLEYAAFKGNVDCVKWLASGYNIRMLPDDKLTKAHKHLILSDEEIIIERKFIRQKSFFGKIKYRPIYVVNYYNTGAGDIEEIELTASGDDKIQYKLIDQYYKKSSDDKEQLLIRGNGEQDSRLLRSMNDLIISHGGYPYLGADSGANAIRKAAWRDHIHIVKILLQHGAKVIGKDNDNQNWRGCNAELRLAAQCGDLWTVSYLLTENLVDPNAAFFSDGYGDYMRPLQLAVQGGHYHIAKCLLDNGAKPDLRAGYKELRVFDGPDDTLSPMELAAKYGDVALLDLVVNSWGDSTPHVLRLAIHYGKLENVAYLIEKKKFPVYSLIYFDIYPDPIQVASTAGHTEIVSYLIGQGAKVNYDLNPPLICAVKHGHLETVKVLLKQGAKLNKTCSGEKTPLHAALESKQYEIATCLVEHGADPNYSTIDSRHAKVSTSFWVALHSGRLDVIECMLKHGADTREADYGSARKESPIQWVARTHRSGILQCLLKHTKTLERDINLSKGQGSALYLAASNGDKTCVNDLLNAGANANTKSKGDLPLHCAARGGHLAIVKALIPKTEDFNQRNENNLTALQEAANFHHIDIVRYLIDQRAEIWPNDNVIILSQTPGAVEQLHRFLGQKVGHDNEIIIINQKNFERISDLIQAAFKDKFTLHDRDEKVRQCRDILRLMKNNCQIQSLHVFEKLLTKIDELEKKYESDRQKWEGNPKVVLASSIGFFAESFHVNQKKPYRNESTILDPKL